MTKGKKLIKVNKAFVHWSVNKCLSEMLYLEYFFKAQYF